MYWPYFQSYNITPLLSLKIDNFTFFKISFTIATPTLKVFFNKYQVQIHNYLENILYQWQLPVWLKSGCFYLHNLCTPLLICCILITYSNGSRKLYLRNRSNDFRKEKGYRIMMRIICHPEWSKFLMQWRESWLASYLRSNFFFRENDFDIPMLFISNEEYKLEYSQLKKTIMNSISQNQNVNKAS